MAKPASRFLEMLANCRRIVRPGVKPQLGYGLLHPAHVELRLNIGALRPQAMHMILVKALFQLTSPDGSSPNIPTFAGQQVAGLQHQTPLFFGCEVHVVEGCQIESAPKHVRRPQEWLLVVTVPRPLIDSFPLLNLEQIP